MNDLARLTSESDPALQHLQASVEETLRRAACLGAPLTFEGIHPLPDKPLRFRGRDRDWILAPFHLDPVLATRGDFPVPSEELRVIDILLADGFDPLVFIGHDVPPKRGVTEPAIEVDHQAVQTLGTVQSQAIMPMREGHEITPSEARRLVSPVVAPRRTRELSERLGQVSDVMIKGLAATATVAFAASVAAVGIAFAPLFVGVAAMGDFIDPIVFGAVPVTTDPQPGSPAAWFVISVWDYE